MRIDPPTMFFGSHTGIFRIFPGRPSDECSPYSEYSVDYDPRRRPWYGAASSGPKNVIFVVDSSASMEGKSLKLLKGALNRTIESLAYGDRLAIVAFNDTAHIIADLSSDKSYFMFKANATNKNMALDEVTRLSAGGANKLIDAFNTTFQIVQNTNEGESIGTPACNTAILFFTDGDFDDEVNETYVKQFVSSGLADLAKNGTNRIFFFTYSLNSASRAQKLPKELACTSEYGIWSKIDNDDDIVKSMSSYYQLFAQGLGKENVTAWVEPYVYSTGGVLGTTVSTPVYDNSREPPIFIGVIGIDFPLGAILKTSDQKTSSEILAYAVGAGTCPEINLTVCLLESLRRLNGGTTCNASCSADEYDDVEASNCSFVEKFPTNIWKNSNSKGKSYVVSV